MNSKLKICMLYDSCFTIKKEFFKTGFPLKIYETIMSIQATYFLSHKIRNNTDLFLIFLSDSFLIHYKGSKLRYLGPDERSIGMLLMKALEKKESLRKIEKIQTTPGIWVKKFNMQDFLFKVVRKAQVLLVDQNSKKITEDTLQADLVLMIPTIPKTEYFEEEYLVNLNYYKFGIQELPQKMRNYLTILKFYSFFDKIEIKEG